MSVLTPPLGAIDPLAWLMSVVVEFSTVAVPNPQLTIFITIKIKIK
jgi:hypothetical protein